MEEAKKLYEVWLRSTPLDRLKITVGIPEALRTARFVRRAARGHVAAASDPGQDPQGVDLGKGHQQRW